MLRNTLAQKQEQIQGSLFLWLVEEIGEINEKQQQRMMMYYALNRQKCCNETSAQPRHKIKYLIESNILAKISCNSRLVHSFFDKNLEHIISFSFCTWVMLRPPNIILNLI